MYIVVRNDAVLSRTSKDALLSWRTRAQCEEEGYYYCIPFPSHHAALLCAEMQGGKPEDFAKYQKRSVVGGGERTGGGMGDGGGTGVVAVGG